MPVLTQAALSSELRIAVMRVARRLRAERADSDLGLTHLAALSTLDGHGAMTPGELAAHEKVRPPSMTKVIARLEERELVRRTAHPTDGRQVIVEVADAGRELLRADRRRRDAWLAQRLAALPAEDVDVLRRAVRILAGLAES